MSNGGGSGGGDGGGGGHADSIWNTGGLRRWKSLPHYYGNEMRQLLLGAAALMLIASPLYGNNLRAEFLLEVIGALMMVALAALINPHNQSLSIGSAVVSGVVAAVYAAWGLFEYDSINPVAFVLRLAIAVILLFGFYFSVKTVRAFMLGQIGKRESVDEFDSDAEKAQTDEFESEITARPDSNR